MDTVNIFCILTCQVKKYTLQFTAWPAANCNASSPFQVAFGEGLDAWNRKVIGRMPCSRVQGTVNSNNTVHRMPSPNMIQFTPPDRYATIRKKGGARRMHCTAGQHIGKVGEGGSYGRPNRKE